MVSLAFLAAACPELDGEAAEEAETSRPKKRRLDKGDVARCGLHSAFQASCRPRPWVTACRWKRRSEVEPPEAAKPLKQAVEVMEFYAFMWRREGLRRRRELLRLPPEQWTHDSVMARIRLTNVKREDDRTTRVMRKICNRYVDEHPELKVLRRTPMSSWDFNLRLSARWLVFNFALWRAFGTDSFAKSIGFLTNTSWGKVQQDAVVAAAMQRWQMGHFNYTDAYDPSRSNHYDEVRARLRGGAVEVHRLYSRTCASLAGLWQACDEIVEVAITTNSWRSVTQCVMKVPGYGGTGFLAKELVQDLLHTPLFEFWSSHHHRWLSSCVDLNSWCAVGPGARRGLNRLHGRRVNWNAYCDDDRVAHQFLRELRQVFGERDKYWHGSLEGRPVFQLELHDVQFQLCELDKYEREKKKPGQVRPYRPSFNAIAEPEAAAEERPEPALPEAGPRPGPEKSGRRTSKPSLGDEISPEDTQNEKKINAAFDFLFAEQDRNAAKISKEMGDAAATGEPDVGSKTD
ncbi:unnamed protein product [Symbiodinium sp. CCMP2456]|nr:unnamed protein product [Symbiodinium sp. CCMP2456]